MDVTTEPGSDLRWWRYEGEALCSNISQTIQQLISRQWWRREADWRHARLYGNYMGIGAQGSPMSRTSLSSGVSRLSLNIIKSMCCAATAKITKSRPKPMFLTSGGDYTEQKKAKQLTKFAEGQFYESDLYSLAPTVFLDATIYGTGFMKIYEEEESIKCDRVFPWEVLVDDADGRDGKPRQMYQVQRMDKLVLCELFPDSEDAIMSAPMVSMYEWETPETSIQGYLSNLIQVREAWHLPSGKNAKDGRHVISIDEAVLLEEEYKCDYFPFVCIRWTKAPCGFWGIGIAEAQTGKQIEINTLLRNIQEGYRLLGKSHWMVESGSKVLSTHIDNIIGSITNYLGIPPQVYTPSVVPPEIYQHLWKLVESAYQDEGISQLSAQGQKQPGIDSGKAIRMVSDIETERFSVPGREYQSFFLEASRQMIDRARDISAKNKDYKVRVEGKSSFESIRWADINLKDDEYVMKCYPINAFSDDPAAKIQQVKDYMDMGMISPEEAKRLFDYPDLQQVEDYEFASHELVMDMIERMVDKGEYNSIEPEMDIADAAKTAQAAYIYYKLRRVPIARLELIQRFLSECMSMLHPPQEQQPMAPPVGAPPPSMGQPPPDMGMPSPGPMPPMPQPVMS